MTEKILKDITKENVCDYSLKHCLNAFRGAQGNSKDEKKENLTKQFEVLATKMIYGGHFEVIGAGEIIRQIYIHTVEFYYHEEFNDDNAVHDYIVYHRNALDGENKYPKTIDPFPVGSLNAHQSGIDITFEDQAGKYRASALIRAFMVKEGWNNESAFFDDFPNNKNKGDTVNPRSTYLYDYLFQNAILPVSIIWRDTPIKSNVTLVPNKRENVYEYEEDTSTGKVKIEKGKPKQKPKLIKNLDQRRWAFRRPNNDSLHIKTDPTA